MTLARSIRCVLVGSLASATVAITAVGLHAAGNSLSPGQSLNPGDFLISNSGIFTLIYQGDGNLVVYRQDGTPIWWTGTDGTAPGAVSVTGDGNVVMTDANGNVLWAAGTGGHSGDSLMMQDSGAVQAVDGNGAVLFDSGSGGGVEGNCGGFGGGSALQGGQVLCPNDAVTSPGGEFQLVYQNDGNLVLYRNDGVPVWWTGTDGTGAGHVSMEPGGNLTVTSASGAVVFATGTDGNPGAFLTVQDNGTVVIFAADGTPIFSAGGN
jgi:hypothetical protein